MANQKIKKGIIVNKRIEEKEILGGNVESARGLRRVIGENNGNAGLNVHELLAVIGI